MNRGELVGFLGPNGAGKTTTMLFTHTLRRAIYDAPRNIIDEQIPALWENGGVIGVNGVGPFLSKDNNPTMEHILRHLNHIVELIGPSHVGLGLDYVVDVDALMKWVWAHPELWLDQPSEPDRYFNPTNLLQFTEGLVEHWYSDEEIKGILGGNFIRVFQQVWK